MRSNEASSVASFVMTQQIAISIMVSSICYPSPPYARHLLQAPRAQDNQRSLSCRQPGKSKSYPIAQNCHPTHSRVKKFTKTRLQKQIFVILSVCFLQIIVLLVVPKVFATPLEVECKAPIDRNHLAPDTTGTGGPKKKSTRRAGSPNKATPEQHHKCHCPADTCAESRGNNWYPTTNNPHVPGNIGSERFPWVDILKSLLGVSPSIFL